MLRGCGLGEKVDKIELAKHADMIADAYWRITAATREANSANWNVLGSSWRSSWGRLGGCLGTVNAILESLSILQGAHLGRLGAIWGRI